MSVIIKNKTKYFIFLVNYINSFGLTFIDFTCPSPSVKCNDNIQCVRKYLFMDGRQDCKDGSDEDPEFYKGNITSLDYIFHNVEHVANYLYSKHVKGPLGYFQNQISFIISIKVYSITNFKIPKTIRLLSLYCTR